MSPARSIDRQSARWRAAEKRQWATRPELRPDGTPYPKNTRLPHYCIHAQDGLTAYPVVIQLYWKAWHKHYKTAIAKGSRRVFQAGITDWAIWEGDVRRELNPNQSDIATVPAPRSSVVHHLEMLERFKLLSRWDSTENRLAPRRNRGDGRHKTTWVLNSFDLALELMAADPQIATPSNRTFWAWYQRPVTNAEAILLKLDEAVAREMPDAWANNARFENPEAPIKPVKRTGAPKPRPPTPDEINVIHAALLGWQVASTPDDARAILQYARINYDIPADALAIEINAMVDGMARLNYSRRAPHVVTVELFTADRGRKARRLAWLWASKREEQQKQQAEASRRAGAAVLRSGHDPP